MGRVWRVKRAGPDGIRVSFSWRGQIYKPVLRGWQWSRGRRQAEQFVADIEYHIRQGSFRWGELQEPIQRSPHIRLSVH